MTNRMISISRQLRRDLTVAEKALWHELRDRRLGGIKFRRQFPIEGFIVDFVCLEARITIELDGPVHKGREYEDALRSHAILAQGFLERRYRNEDVFDRLSWVLEDIRKNVERRMQTPHPSCYA
jgi:very-short-patch-repair endonuclease